VKQIPTLNTRRLELRPFTPTDAPVVQRLAGERAIADTTCNIPHPYEDGLAEAWIASHRDSFDRGSLLALAVVDLQAKILIGAVSLMNISPKHGRGELGYWIGTPHWNKGYCTEAAKCILDYGFSTLKLRRIHGCFMKRNPASRRVMEKIGMREEGCLRQHDRKWEQPEDIVLFGILRNEWEEYRTCASRRTPEDGRL